MKYLTIIASITLISSYSLAMEDQPDSKKSPSITLHNQLYHYDINTEGATIAPGESKTIYLQPGIEPELAVFIDALENKELTLEFKKPLPKKVCFTYSNKQ